jgi:RNA-binding protein YhbY
MNYDPYPIRFRPDERAMLKELARRLERRESETVRVLVRGAYQIMLKEQEKNTKRNLQAA